MLKYEGGSYFRQKIVCATLAGKSVKLSNVRLEEENVGLAGAAPHNPPSLLHVCSQRSRFHTSPR